MERCVDHKLYKFLYSTHCPVTSTHINGEHCQNLRPMLPSIHSALCNRALSWLLTLGFILPASPLHINGITQYAFFSVCGKWFPYGFLFWARKTNCLCRLVYGPRCGLGAVGVGPSRAKWIKFNTKARRHLFWMLRSFWPAFLFLVLLKEDELPDSQGPSRWSVPPPWLLPWGRGPASVDGDAVTQGLVSLTTEDWACLCLESFQHVDPLRKRMVMFCSLATFSLPLGSADFTGLVSLTFSASPGPQGGEGRAAGVSGILWPGHPSDSFTIPFLYFSPSLLSIS